MNLFKLAFYVSSVLVLLVGLLVILQALYYAFGGL